MFVKRDDGLGRVFIPFHIPALVLGALLTFVSRVRGLWIAPVFVGWSLAAFVALLVLFYLGLLVYSLLFIDIHTTPPTEDHPLTRRVVVFVIGQLCRFARVRIHMTGAEQVPDGRFVIVSNHRSMYDPITTVWMLRRHDMAFITKPENHKAPIAGPFIFKANYLPIDRENPRNAMATINAAANLLKNDVCSVGVYPEGTRSRDGQMLPFHNGVFKIAQKAKAPLVVLSVRGTEHISQNFPWRHTDVYLNVCAVLRPEDLPSSTNEISEHVRSLLEQDLADEVKTPVTV